jgi:hypothetical protein
MWFTKCNLEKIELIKSDMVQEQKQNPEDIYPVGNQLPTPPNIPTGAVQESDFDFSNPEIGSEQIPF